MTFHGRTFIEKYVKALANMACDQQAEMKIEQLQALKFLIAITFSANFQCFVLDAISTRSHLILDNALFQWQHCAWTSSDPKIFL